MPATAKRRPHQPAPAGLLAFGALQAATASILPGLVLAAAGAFWHTLRQENPAGAGEQAVAWLLLAAAAACAVAAGAAALSFVQGSGPWRARLRHRAALALVLLALAAALLLAVWGVTAAPALAVPAQLAAAGAALAASAVLARRAPAAAAWDVRRLGPIELQMLVAVAMAATLLLGVLARPWETATLTAAALLPPWVLTTVSVGIGTGLGMYLLQALRRPGAGFMALLLAFAVRSLLIGVLQRPLGGFTGAAPAFLLMLAPAGLLDLFYLYNMRRGDAPRLAWQALTSAVTGSLLGSLLVLETLTAYPPVNGETIPGIIVAGAAAGFGAGWLGMTAGRHVRRVDAVPPEGRRWLDFTALGLAVAALAAAVALAAGLQ